MTTKQPQFVSRLDPAALVAKRAAYYETKRLEAEAMERAKKEEAAKAALAEEEKKKKADEAEKPKEEDVDSSDLYTKMRDPNMHGMFKMAVSMSNQIPGLFGMAANFGYDFGMTKEKVTQFVGWFQQLVIFVWPVYASKIILLWLLIHTLIQTVGFSDTSANLILILVQWTLVYINFYATPSSPSNVPEAPQSQTIKSQLLNVLQLAKVRVIDALQSTKQKVLSKVFSVDGKADDSGAIQWTIPEWVWEHGTLNLVPEKAPFLNRIPYLLFLNTLSYLLIQSGWWHNVATPLVANFLLWMFPLLNMMIMDFQADRFHQYWIVYLTAITLGQFAVLPAWIAFIFLCILFVYDLDNAQNPSYVYPMAFYAMGFLFSVSIPLVVECKLFVLIVLYGVWSGIWQLFVLLRLGSSTMSAFRELQLMLNIVMMMICIQHGFLRLVHITVFIVFWWLPVLKHLSSTS